MSRIKDHYHDKLERRRCEEDGRCGECGQDAHITNGARLCLSCIERAIGKLP